MSGGRIYASADSGVTWAPRDVARDWSTIASSADGTRVVAAVQLGQIYTSTGTITGRQYSTAELVYAGAGLWILVSQQGSVASQ